jgi:hypothetical protein
MIFEKNAKTGELAFSKSFLLMVYLFAVFYDLERVMMSSEVFFKWQRRIFTVFNTSFNCLPDGKKNFSLHKKFPEKIYFFNYITFSRSSKRRKRKYQQKSFLKHN